LAIKGFSHKGLKKYYLEGNTAGIDVNHAEKIGYFLDAVHSSHHPKDLKGIYQNKFTEKKGSGKGVFSYEISGKWRITFQIEDDGAVFLDYLDYHGKSIKAR
jgi:proteic killer suppression protein